MERLVGAPHAAARRGDIQATVALRAVRRQRQRRHAAGRDVRRGVAKRVQDARNIGDAWADQLPRARRVRARVQRLPAVPGANRRLGRHVVGRKRALQEVLHRRRIEPTIFVLAEQGAFVRLGAAREDSLLHGEPACDRPGGRDRRFGRDKSQGRSSEDNGSDNRKAEARTNRIRTTEPAVRAHGESSRVWACIRANESVKGRSRRGAYYYRSTLWDAMCLKCDDTDARRPFPFVRSTDV